jgi:hypothetical protein
MLLNPHLRIGFFVAVGDPAGFPVYALELFQVGNADHFLSGNLPAHFPPLGEIAVFAVDSDVAFLAQVNQIFRIISSALAARNVVVNVTGNPLAAGARAFNRLAGQLVFEGREDLLECSHK